MFLFLCHILLLFLVLLILVSVFLAPVFLWKHRHLLILFLFEYEEFPANLKSLSSPASGAGLGDRLVILASGIPRSQTTLEHHAINVNQVAIAIAIPCHMIFIGWFSPYPVLATIP